MVLTLIRATRKTNLNRMSSLSVCLVPKVHCKRSQQLRTICTCVTDNTHKFDTHRRCKELLKQNGLCLSRPFVLCLRIAFDITIMQTIKRFYRLQDNSLIIRVVLSVLRGGPKISPHFHLMLLFFQSSGLCVQSPSIIPVPGYPLCLVCHFPIGILGQVWYLIVSIPDLCTLTYLSN